MQNYFELFKLAVQFEIDLNALNERYRELQKTWHPDNFVQASEAERAAAMQQTTLLNEALQTLKNPISRGRYLLELQGVVWNDVTDTTMDASFLMEQIELREQLENIKKLSDPMLSISHFLDHIEDSNRLLIQQLTLALQQQQYNKAKDLIRRLQFFNKLKEEALFIEENLMN